MSKVKILWLYNDIMDLYGDGGNIMAISYQLRKMGIDCQIDHCSLNDSITFEGYNLIYMGPGKDKNAIMVANDLKKYKNEIKSAIENNQLFLITGNAGLIFGKEIVDEDGHKHEGVGVFDYTSEILGKVFIADFIATYSFEPNEKIYGFINRTSLINSSETNELFNIEYSSENIGKKEGMIYKNFIRTWALGPVLVKNPFMLKYILEKMLSEDTIELEDSLLNIAHEKTLAEF